MRPSVAARGVFVRRGRRWGAAFEVVCEHAFVSVTANAELVKALERRSLPDAEEAARGLERVEPEHALAIVLLMGDERDVRYEPALVRWVGQWLAAHPGVGLSHAADLIDSLADLSGASPDVARSRAAVLLRSVGSDGPAGVLERW